MPPSILPKQNLSHPNSKRFTPAIYASAILVQGLGVPYEVRQGVWGLHSLHRDLGLNMYMVQGLRGLVFALKGLVVSGQGVGLL